MTYRRPVRPCPARPRRRPVTFRPSFDILEDRCLLSIGFSVNGGSPGEVAGGQVGTAYTAQHITATGASGLYDFSLASGWSLPNGLMFSADGTTPASSDVVKDTSGFYVIGTPAAGEPGNPSGAGQYNVAFLATDHSDDSITGTVVYHFLISPAGGVFQGSVSTTLAPPSGTPPQTAQLLGYNALVLAPGTTNQPYNAQIALSNGQLQSVALLTEETDGSLQSAVTTVSGYNPVPGLIAVSNVTGVDATTGAIASGATGANVAGLTITWTSSASGGTVTLGGTPTVSAGGPNDPLLLQLTDSNGDTLYYNLGIQHSPAQIADAYGLDQIVFPGGVQGNGAGQTVVILSTNDNSSFVSSTDPNWANSDLNLFDQEFPGLNTFQTTPNQTDGPYFLKLDDTGGTDYPSQANDSGEDPTEMPQDVEWVHALAPMANIIVLEGDIDTSLDTIAKWVNGTKVPPNLPLTNFPLPSVVSSSFGSSSLNGASFVNGVTYVASSGDFAAADGTQHVTGNPSNSVVEAGYAQLQVSDGQGTYGSEAAVNQGTMQTTGRTFQSSGGASPSVPQLSYQTNVPNTSSQGNPINLGTGLMGRTDPDVAFNGSEVSGDVVYNSFENTARADLKVSFGGSPNSDIYDVTYDSTTGLATITTDNALTELNAGAEIAISGVKGAFGVNGVWTVETVDVTTDRFKIALSADPGTYQSGGSVSGINYAFGGLPWGDAWGTSITAPSWAALFAIANQGRQLANNNVPNPLTSTQTLQMLYSLANTPAFHTIGNTINQTTQGQTPVGSSDGAAYYNDFAGLGSPAANILVPDLVGWQPPPLLPALRYTHRRELFGAFIQQGTSLVSPVQPAFALTELPAPSFQNPTVQATVNVNTAQVVGVAARIQANGEAYVAAITNAGIAEILFYQAARGSYTVLNSAAMPGDATAATVQFVLNGLSLSLYINGGATPLVTATDSSITSPGGVGLFAQGDDGIITNFSVTGS